MTRNHSQRRPNRTSRRLQLENLEVRNFMHAGDLDPDFAAGGLLRLPLAFAASDTVAPYTDSAAGGLFVQNRIDPTSVSRFDTTGALDLTYGTDGSFSAPYVTSAIQSDGSLIAATISRPSNIIISTNTELNNTAAVVSSTYGLIVGLNVEGAGIDIGTTITALDPVTRTITLSQAATVTATSELTFTNPNPVTGYGFDISLRKYDSTGLPDGTFGNLGTFGVANIDFNSEITFGNDQPVERVTDERLPVAIKIAPGTNKIWALSDGDLSLRASFEFRPGHYFGLARLNSDGTPDNTFSNNGLFISESLSGINQVVPTDLVLTQDGGALIVGYEIDPLYNPPGGNRVPPFNTDFPPTLVAVRVDAAGNLVTGFGTNGKLTLSSLGAVAQGAKIRAALDSSSGRFVFGFYQPTANENEFELKLARVTSQGLLDSNFGTSGVVATGHLETGTGFGAVDDFGIAVQQTDAKPVIAFGNPAWIVRRYSATGTLDTGFGLNGQVVTPLSQNSADNAIPTDVDIQFDGKIVVTGGFLPQAGLTFPSWNSVGKKPTQVKSNFGVNPTELLNQALITNESGAVTANSMETTFGLAAGTFDGMGHQTALEGSAAYRTITVSAGDTLTFDWNYLTDVFTSGDDFSFVMIKPSTGPATLLELSSTNTGTFNVGNSAYPDETGYQAFTHTFTTAGTYTIAFGVIDGGANINESGGDSALLIDNFEVNNALVTNGGFEDYIYQEIVVARYLPQDIGTTDAASQVLSLPTDTFTNQFTVSWSGTASAGIKNYDIYYVIDGGTPVLWQAATTATSAVFNIPAARRHTIGFYSIIHDNADAQEAFSGVDAQTNFVGAPWQNPIDQYDVVEDATDPPNLNVEIDDILAVVFEFNARLISSRIDSKVTLPPTVNYLSGPYYDITGDNIVDINDILAVVFRYNQQRSGIGGESVTPADFDLSSMANGATSETNDLSANVAYMLGYDLTNRRGR